MSNVGHAALADMLSLYVRKEVCETQRAKLAPPPARSAASLELWPLDEDMGAVPELALWSKVSVCRMLPRRQLLDSRLTSLYPE